jgi:hypothetical protein
MPAPPEIIKKIKLLINLSKSSNLNEATNARKKADDLIFRYNVSESELLDNEDQISENKFLFESDGLILWKAKLAMIVATYFDCLIFQEELRPENGLSHYKYYLLGTEEDTDKTKLLFNTLSEKCSLIILNILYRGEIYTSSFKDGLIDGIKENISFIEVQINKTVAAEPAPELNVSSNNLATVPEKNKVDVPKTKLEGGQLVKDVMAYFAGLQAGKDILIEINSLNDSISNYIKLID